MSCVVVAWKYLKRELKVKNNLLSKPGIWNELLSEAMSYVSLKCTPESLDLLTKSLDFVTKPAEGTVFPAAPKGNLRPASFNRKYLPQGVPRGLTVPYLILRKRIIFPVSPKHLNINYSFYFYFFVTSATCALAPKSRTRTGRLPGWLLVTPARREKEGPGAAASTAASFLEKLLLK